MDENQSLSENDANIDISYTEKTENDLTGIENMELKIESDGSELKVESESDTKMKDKDCESDCISEKERYILQCKNALTPNILSVGKIHPSPCIEGDVIPSKIPRCNDENVSENSVSDMDKSYLLAEESSTNLTKDHANSLDSNRIDVVADIHV